jgi:hypothetical protein
MVAWDVENVKAVYYENLGVDGHGQKEECLKDKRGEYTLVVLFANGNTQTYTATVELILPTTTPEPTATFTPEPVLTPTWTPVVPTHTPTPDYDYGVLLAVNGNGQQSCQPGQSCEIGLLVTNTGNTTDNLSVLIVQAGPWTSWLCRPDGVCSGTKLTLLNVGAANTAFIRLVVTIPGDAAAQTGSYSLRALSEASNGAAASDVITVEIQVQS